MTAPADWQPDLAALRAAFEDNFALGLECGAAVSVWRDGREVLSLVSGHLDATRAAAWTPETLVLTWSATKGPAAATVLALCEREGISLGTRVAALWPEFAAAGKESLRLEEVLSHRGGLFALANRGIPFQDHEAVAAALAAQAPLPAPGSAHAYGPRIFGYLLDELCRRISGRALGECWREIFAEPLGLDFWIGLPASKFARTATILAPRLTAATGEKTDFEEAYATAGSPTHAAFSTPAGLRGISMMNRAEMRQGCFPAFGGIGSARALGKFYALLASGGELDGARVIAPGTIARMSRRLSDGPDGVLCRPTAFSAGCMLDPLDGEGQKIRNIFGPSSDAFGHPGAGGSLAFADPGRGFAFAYVMNQMEPGAFPRERALRLVRAVYADEDRMM